MTHLNHYHIPVAQRGEYVLTANQVITMATTTKQWMDILRPYYSVPVQPRVRRRQTW